MIGHGSPPLSDSLYVLQPSTQHIAISHGQHIEMQQSFQLMDYALKTLQAGISIKRSAHQSEMFFV
jgi:hypothetical protein